MRERIPAIDGWLPFARAGNLMIHGPVLEDCYLRLAGYVDRILEGASAAELPVERPTEVELVVNSRGRRRCTSRYVDRSSCGSTR